MTEHKIEAALSALLISTVLTTRQEYVIWAWCGVGGIISGYVGSVLFPMRSIEFRRRWIVNFALAIIAAPFLTWWLLPKFPATPLPFLSMIVSGTCGACGVLILPLILRKNGIHTGKNEDPRGKD